MFIRLPQAHNNLELEIKFRSHIEEVKAEEVQCC